MTTTTLTGREFNQDTARAKRAASAGPVFITDRGRPAHVLLTVDHYRRLTDGERTAADAFAQAGGAECDFDAVFERVRELPRDLDLG